MRDWSKVIAESSIYGVSGIGQTFLKEWADLVKCFALYRVGGIGQTFCGSRWDWSNLLR